MCIAGSYCLSVLAAGGYIGGSLVFVYGQRVLKRSDVKPSDALIPGRAGAEPEAPVRRSIFRRTE